MQNVPTSAANSHADKFWVYRPILNLLGKSEGTDRGDGYNETLAYGKMIDGKVTKGPGVDILWACSYRLQPTMHDGCLRNASPNMLHLSIST